MTNRTRLAKDAQALRLEDRIMSDPLVLIPARLAAMRLPNKPLADIAGEPMIVHVWRRAMEAGIGPVAVATDAPEIAEAVTRAGGQAVMTRADHASGSDRIFEAVEKLDPEGRHDVIRREEEKTNPNVVKLVGSEISPGRFRALYFTRATAPYGDGPLYHHIGLYAYRRRALQRFVGLKPSSLEMREKLEQLRALEAGMRIDAVVVDDVPLGVDTPHDLERAREIIAARASDPKVVSTFGSNQMPLL